MTDLAGFLLARLTEDEVTARAATPGPWTAKRLRGNDLHFGRMDFTQLDAESGNLFAVADMPLLDAVHIVRHDPARVLAEVAAKRRIVELHAITVSKVEMSLFDPDTGERRTPEYEVWCAVCGWASDDPMSACDTVRLLAQPYADHPNFDPAWRVDEAPTSRR